MNSLFKTNALVSGLMLIMSCSVVQSAIPKFYIVPSPKGSNSQQANKGDIITLNYIVTNNLNSAKTLRMIPLTGVTQVTRGKKYCNTIFTLKPKDSCTLRLKVDTNFLPVGSKLQNGPEICIGPSRLSCSRPSPGNLLDIHVETVPAAPLTASSLDVVTATSGAGGTLRTVHLINHGNSATNNLRYNDTDLPSGTLVSSTCSGGGNLLIIGANSTCTLTITPGPTPNTVEPISPAPRLLTLVGDNTNKLVIDVTVLTYGNIYQGGYLFKVNGSTPATRNIGGTIAALSDLQNSTKLSWKPEGPVLTVNNSVSVIDGVNNSKSIIGAYKQGDYAAYDCSQLKVDEDGSACLQDQTCFSNWYLPAICELGNGDTYSSNCTSYPNNMTSNLYLKGIGNFKTGGAYSLYWSSTTYTAGADAEAWQMSPQTASPYGMYPNNYWNFYVRCARSIT